MDVHERFMRHRPANLSCLLPLVRSTSFQKLIDNFHNALSSDEYSLKSLEVLRTVLCAYYQDSIISKNEIFIHRWDYDKINDDCLYISFFNYPFDDEVARLLFDITSLILVLRYNDILILKHVDQLRDWMHTMFHKESCWVNIFYMNLMICYIDSLYLYKRRFELTENSYIRLVEIFSMNDLKMWFTLKDRKQCQLLTLLTQKLMKVIEVPYIPQKIWTIINFKNLDDALYMLCLTADILFPSESVCIVQLIDTTLEEPFWLFLLKGLLSSVPEQRKQALYLLKRAVDFVDKNKTQILKMKTYEKVKPLICTEENESSQISFKIKLNNFFLILEALEEKQKHLVTPIFPFLKTLLDETFHQANYQAASIHIAWIRCIFIRILQHDNNAITKWGLLNIFTLDPELCDDDLLSLVLEVLNNTYLYENEQDGESIIVKHLIKFLNCAETNNNPLVTRFLIKASKMTWGPTALFHIIHALSMVKQVNSIWKEDHLESVKSLAEMNLNMHCRILRIGSQIELLEALTHFATEPLDLVVVTNTLSAFPIDEALIRGQLAWKRITTWLSKIVKGDEAQRFFENICCEMIDDSSKNLTMSIKSFALITMLFYDANLILNSKQCPGLTVLYNLLHCLIGANSRPYANTELRKNAIEFIGNLLNFTSPKDYILRDLISDHTDATLCFIFKNFQKISDQASVDDINKFILVTRQLFIMEHSLIPNREILNHIERFETESVNIIEDEEYSNNMQRFFSLKVLHACLNATSEKLRNYKFIKPLYSMYKTLTMNKGRIAAEYYEYVAKLFHEYVTDEFVDNWIPDIDWIEEVSYLVQVGDKNILTPLVGILSQIFYKETVKANNIDAFKSTLRSCWNSLLESNECRLATEELIDLIFSSPFLECNETKELTIQLTCEMMGKGDKIPTLRMILLKGLKKLKGEYFSHFYELLLDCLLHGTVPRRDQKIELQTRSYIFDRYQEVYPNYLSNMNVDINAATRACAFTLLHKIITDDPAHVDQLLPLIIVKLVKTQNKRYFGDSQTHRLKNRIMQVLLILQPVLARDNIKFLHTLVCNNMLESSQPSVRIMQEWLLVRIYLGSNTLCTEIWKLFNQGQETRVGSLCSVISIVYHVARLLSPDLQMNFINLALRHITPCCMSQQFNVRLYAQVIASKLYALANEMSFSTVVEKYEELYIGLTKSLKYGNLMKNSVKLQDDFYFTIFNPIDDYSLQTLFYDLPRLSNVSSDEHILPHMFEKFGFKEINSHPLKLLNLKTDISEAQVSEHILKSSASAGPLSDDVDNSIVCSDVQKKFIPWKSMMPNKDDLSDLSEGLVSHQEALIKGNDIILVASLIDKLPNLGGLSRTCEIFGVKEFVISSIKHTEEKDFQSLSVSAEKLVPLIEVKPHQLQQYLLEKKDMGYQLVGAEQTVNSTNLLEMKFEKKTVLLLGNEKAGIPANLIPLLDKCVEIPQAGVVRSLNVHVTGAICLWEYFKQYHSS